jgi:tetratricopeptide (TPR) repeat protein
MEAWDYFLQGYAETATFAGYVDVNGQPVTPERNRRAKELVNQAIAIDPNFALGYMLLAHIDAVAGIGLRNEMGAEAADAALLRARENARRGRELNPFSASTCSCYAYILTYLGEARQAVAMQEEAVRLNPANAQAHAILAKVYENLGRYEEALPEINIAKRLSPRDVDMSFYISIEAAIHLGMGHYEVADQVAQRSIMLTPLNHDAHAISIAALFALERYDEAELARQDLMEQVPLFSADMLWESDTAPLWQSMIAVVETTGANAATYRQLITGIMSNLNNRQQAAIGRP